MAKKSIILSKKHGANPTILHCEICGKEYGVGLLGKLKGDKQAPMHSVHGVCTDCQTVINNKGIIFIEVKDGSGGDTPEKTGRIMGLTKEWKEANHFDMSVAYMEHKIFDQWFGPYLMAQENAQKIKSIKCPRGIR